MPTGTAIPDAREQLFAAAERVLLRDGVQSLTSRAVTAEAGVAKGVLHRHFADFDDFLVELIRDRISVMRARSAELMSTVGSGSVVDNVTDALVLMFTSVATRMVGLITVRDELRIRLRAAGHEGVPVATDAAWMIREYLAAEREQGRLRPDADLDSIGLTLIGGGQLLYESGTPDFEAVRRLAVSTLAGAIADHAR
ncbi:TetR/AcrR family transcriptional regulator [Microlunatus sp. Gsoil 973]|uniref:TetR/AcrR family transcriptional regulator n=1 Tax=Microlunatus sp. Gsoil 973 TaxID=2672569 RepID=UPI0012B4D765|nr:TetR/AcrR family transcriptional regulator [Microlunatus sp. Gsoil 973]QGN34204.1 TetR family transcriptional regulator [Microlunatus sp. Gsoil 973]